MIVNHYKDNSPIVSFSGDDDEPYCEKCGLKLIPWSNERLLCSDCERFYDRAGTLLHKKGFGPVESKQDTGVSIVPMKTYHDRNSKKRASVFDREEKALYTRAGFSWIDEVTIWPED